MDGPARDPVTGALVENDFKGVAELVLKPPTPTVSVVTIQLSAPSPGIDRSLPTLRPELFDKILLIDTCDLPCLIGFSSSDTSNAMPARRGMIINAKGRDVYLTHPTYITHSNGSPAKLQLIEIGAGRYIDTGPLNAYNGCALPNREVTAGALNGRAFRYPLPRGYHSVRVAGSFMLANGGTTPGVNVFCYFLINPQSASSPDIRAGAILADVPRDDGTLINYGNGSFLTPLKVDYTGIGTPIGQYMPGFYGADEIPIPAGAAIMHLEISPTAADAIMSLAVTGQSVWVK